MKQTKITRTYLKNTYIRHREEPPQGQRKGDDAICAVDIVFI